MSKRKQRQFFLWNRANFNEINENMKHFAESFLELSSIHIQELWDVFKKPML